MPQVHKNKKSIEQSLGFKLNRGPGKSLSIKPKQKLKREKNIPQKPIKQDLGFKLNRGPGSTNETTIPQQPKSKSKGIFDEITGAVKNLILPDTTAVSDATDTTQLNKTPKENKLSDETIKSIDQYTKERLAEAEKSRQEYNNYEAQQGAMMAEGFKALGETATRPLRESAQLLGKAGSDFASGKVFGGLANTGNAIFNLLLGYPNEAIAPVAGAIGNTKIAKAIDETPVAKVVNSLLTKPATTAMQGLSNVTGLGMPSKGATDLGDLLGNLLMFTGAEKALPKSLKAPKEQFNPKLEMTPKRLATLKRQAKEGRFIPGDKVAPEPKPPIVDIPPPKGPPKEPPSAPPPAAPGVKATPPINDIKPKEIKIEPPKEEAPKGLDKATKKKIARLKWYKDHGMTKASMIKQKVFPKDFIEKHYGEEIKSEVKKPEIKPPEVKKPEAKPEPEVKPIGGKLSVEEAKKVKLKTMGTFAEGITLNSPKLKEYANEKLPTVEMIKRLKKIGMFDQATEMAKSLSKGERNEEVKGATFETVGRVMLKHAEELRPEEKPKVEAPKVEAPKVEAPKVEKPKPEVKIKKKVKKPKVEKPEEPIHPIDRIVEHPINELPENLNKRVVAALEDMRDILKRAYIKRTGSFGEGRIGSTTESTFPQWFSDLRRTRAHVLAAFDKILDPKTKEKGRLVSQLKSIAVDRLMGQHVEDVLIGSSGKFKREFMGEIPADQQFMDLIQGYDKPLTKAEFEAAWKKVSETSFKPGIDFYKPDIKPPEKTEVGKMQVETRVKKGKIVKAQDIIKDMSKTLGVPIRVGKFREKALGIFKRKPEVIRLAEARMVAVATHEIAHYIDKINRLRQTVLRRFSDELQPLDYDQSKRRNFEGFAEFVRHYLTMDDAAEVAPKVFDWFENDFLAKRPNLKKFFERQKRDITRWRDEGSLLRVISSIDFGPQGAWEVLKDKSVKFAKFARKAPTDFLHAWEDKFHPMKKIIRQILDENDAQLRPSDDPTKLISYLEKTSAAKARQFMTEGGFNFALQKKYKSLKEIVEPVSSKKKTENGLYPIQEALAYAYAKHGETLWNRTEEQGGPVNPGISMEDIKVVLKDHYKPEYETFSKELTQYSNVLLDYLIESGAMSNDLKTKFRQMNPFYIPLKRVIDDYVGSLVSGKKGYVDQPSLFHRIKGSGREIINPLESIIQQTEAIISAADKAWVARSLADLQDKFGGLGHLIEKLPTPMKKTSFKLERIAKQLENSGLDLENADLQQIIDLYGQGKSYMPHENIATIWRNGKREFYQIDPELLKTLRGLDRIQVSRTVDILFGKAARMQRLGATGIRPGFTLITNWLRDLGTYSIQTVSKANPVSAVEGIIEGLRGKSEYSKMFKRGGGEMAQPLGADRRYLQNAVNEILANDNLSKIKYRVRHPFEAARELMSFTEAGPRLAEYRAVMERFKPKIEAAERAGDLVEAHKLMEDAVVEAGNAANEVTVNFKRAGTYAEFLNQIIPFFNPTIQGQVNMLMTLKRNPVRSVIRATAQLTAPTLFLWNENKDKEWYKALPEWEKYSFWHFNLGSEDTPNILRIPKPFEWGYIFAGIPEAIANSNYEKDGKFLEGALWQAALGALPTAKVATVTPAGEAWMNYDIFRDRPIIPKSLQDLKASEQYTEYTTEFSKKIGKILNVAPKSLDHMLSGYTGGLALDIVKGLEGIGKPSTIKEPADIPIVGRLFVRKSLMGTNSRQVREFYDAYEKATKVKRTFDRAQEQAKNRKELKDRFTMSEEDKKFYAQYEKLKETATKLNKLRDILQKIDNEDLSAGYKSQLKQAIQHAAYMEATLATDFLRSKQAIKNRKEFLFKGVPEKPNKK